MNLRSLLYKVFNIHKKKAFEILQSENIQISSGQPKVLDYLAKNKGCMPKDLALACEIEPASVTNLLTNMEKQGLIERNVNLENRRTILVNLTEKGVSVQHKLSAASDAASRIGFRGFSAQEREDFLEMLNRFYNNLSQE